MRPTIYKPSYFSEQSFALSFFRLSSPAPCPPPPVLRTPPSAAARGFTLIELLVVVGIITLITLLLLAKHGQFNNSVLLRSLAYDVALSVREAQTFALSVRQLDGGVFSTGYGTYFASANPTTYILFADRNRNFRYDGEGESVEIFSVRRGYGIARFCASLASGVEKCAPGELTALSITFDRPEPDAIIRSDLGNDVYTSAFLEIASPEDVRMRVDIESTGQISVAN